MQKNKYLISREVLLNNKIIFIGQFLFRNINKCSFNVVYFFTVYKFCFIMYYEISLKAILKQLKCNLLYVHLYFKTSFIQKHKQCFKNINFLNVTVKVFFVAKIAEYYSNKNCNT